MIILECVLQMHQHVTDPNLSAVRICIGAGGAQLHWEIFHTSKLGLRGLGPSRLLPVLDLLGLPFC